MRKQNRAPLFTVLRTAFGIGGHSKKEKSAPVDELMEMQI